MKTVVVSSTYQGRKAVFRDERVIEGFLLLPRCINVEWRWLEKAKRKQIYEGYTKDEGWLWRDECWVD